MKVRYLFMKLREIINKNVSKLMNMLALRLVVQTANSACAWFAYQPEFPEAADKYKKVK